MAAAGRPLGLANLGGRGSEPGGRDGVMFIGDPRCPVLRQGPHRVGSPIIILSREGWPRARAGTADDSKAVSVFVGKTIIIPKISSPKITNLPKFSFPPFPPPERETKDALGEHTPLS